MPSPARHALGEASLRLYLEQLDEILRTSGSEYFVGGELTMADLKIFILIRQIESGNLDYIPLDLVQRTAPVLSQHAERVAGHPGITRNYAKEDVR